MATSQILQYAGDPSANVISQATYAALAALTTGFTSGTALSAQLNKVWRQSNFMASGFAAWMVDQSVSVLDDGDLSGLVDDITQALSNFISNKFGSLAQFTKTVSLSTTTANNSSYGLAAQNVTFPANDSPAKYRIKGHVILNGANAIGDILQNFQLSLTDGTTTVLGALWLISTVGNGGATGVGMAVESYFMFPTLYDPGDVETFQARVSTLGGGGHTGQMAMQSVQLDLQVENA